jgi:hypothetical protein
MDIFLQSMSRFFKQKHGTSWLSALIFLILKNHEFPTVQGAARHFHARRAYFFKEPDHHGAHQQRPGSHGV